MKRITYLSAGLFLSLALAHIVQGQALPTAGGPGSYVSAGISASAFQSDYGKQYLAGPTVFVDAHPTWRYGVEAEARWLHYHTSDQLTERVYLAGAHVYAWKNGRFRVYGKFLVGQAKMVFPFNYATGTYLAYAPGGGVDYELNDHVSIRAVDFEYQSWPQFTYGKLDPYGISAGLTIRLNPIKIFPQHRYKNR